MAIPNGNIYLLKDVPLTSSYEHTIDFKNKDEQFSYFYSFLKYSLEKYTYIRQEREYIAVELPINDLDNVNYLMFRSKDGERLYYAFVGDKIYKGPATSYIYFSIDVMQTFQFDYKWNASYIKQSHVDRWTPEHKPIYSKTEEGLNYGSEYAVESAFKLEQSVLLKWLLVSMVDYSAIIDTGANIPGGTLNPAPSPFINFLIPIPIGYGVTVGDYRVCINDIVSDSTNENYTGEIGTYTSFIKLLNKSATGNYVKSVSLLTYNPFIDSEVADGLFIIARLRPGITAYKTRFKNELGTPENKSYLVIADVVPDMLKGGQLLASAPWDTGLEDTLPTNKQWDEIKKKPYTTKRDKRFESKLLCAPYRYNLLSDWRNSPAIFKNEYMTTDKINVKYSYGMSYNAPFRFWIEDYKKDPEGRYTCLSQPIAPEFPVLSDAYYTYMLENKNTIQANMTNAIISAGTGTISGAISGAGVGGVWGGIYGGVTSGISGGLNVQAHIRSENAKQADLRTRPDGIINSVDSSFNVNDNNVDVTFYRMRICCENEEIISEIFNMHGYTVNRVDVPNTRSRTRFNYIQTIGANITGSFSQAEIAKIKEIYDNGITIWHYHESDFNMLDYSYENVEVNLI